MQANLKTVITETTINLAKSGWFTFASPVANTKPQLRKLIEKLFKVNVIDIKTSVVKGKNKRSLKSRRMRKQSNWKKVMVKVKEGQKIESFDIGA